MNGLLVVVIVVLATAMWPLNRWAVRRGARPQAAGLVISFVGVAVGTILSLAIRSPIFVRPAIELGALAGVAYAIGSVLIIFHCLKIGPAGPTVLMNNLGMVWPIAISMIYFSHGAAPPLLQCVGLGCIALTLALVGLNRDGSQANSGITGQWAMWALAGWAFSGFAQGCQFFASQWAPQAPLAFVVWLYAVSLVILLALTIAQRGGWPNRVEIIAGAGTGTMLAIAIALTNRLLSTGTPAIILLPVTVAGPILAMLLIGQALLKEKLNAQGWASGALGIIGIVLLAFTGRPPSA